MEGENFVRLKGKIFRPQLQSIGDSSLFKANFGIPSGSGGYQYIKISSFKCADALGDLVSGVFIEIYGHIEEHAFNGKCRHCGGFDRKYWTEVVVDYFKEIEDA